MWSECIGTVLFRCSVVELVDKIITPYNSCYHWVIIHGEWKGRLWILELNEFPTNGGGTKNNLQLEIQMWWDIDYLMALGTEWTRGGISKKKLASFSSGDIEGYHCGSCVIDNFIFLIQRIMRCCLILRGVAFMYIL